MVIILCLKADCKTFSAISKESMQDLHVILAIMLEYTELRKYAKYL